jgi:hypothetical protein
LRGQLAAKLNKSVADVRVESRLSPRSPDSKQVKIRLQGGGAIELVTSVGLEDRRGLVAQAGFAAFLVFATAAL